MNKRELQICNYLLNLKNKSILIECAKDAQFQILNGQDVIGSITGAIMGIARPIKRRFKNTCTPNEFKNIIQFIAASNGDL